MSAWLLHPSQLCRSVGGAAWHEGVSCREELQSAGGKAGGFSDHVAPHSYTNQKAPLPLPPHTSLELSVTT